MPDALKLQVDYALRTNVMYALWKPSAPTGAPEYGSLILDTATKKARVTTRVKGGEPVVTLYDPNEWQFRIKESGFLIPPMIWSQGILMYATTTNKLVELAHVIPMKDSGSVMDFDKGEYQVRTQSGKRTTLSMRRVLTHIVAPGVKLLLDASKLPDAKDRVDGEFFFVDAHLTVCLDGDMWAWQANGLWCGSICRRPRPLRQIRCMSPTFGAPEEPVVPGAMRARWRLSLSTSRTWFSTRHSRGISPTMSSSTLWPEAVWAGVEGSLSLLKVCVLGGGIRRDMEDLERALPYDVAPPAKLNKDDSATVDPVVKLTPDDEKAKKRSLLCATTLEEDCHRILRKLLAMFVLAGVLTVCVFFCPSCLLGVLVFSVATCMCIPEMNIPLWISLVLLLVYGFELVHGDVTLAWKSKLVK